MSHTWAVPLEDLHTDRDRAVSFGSSAGAYDEFRPGYPPALFDDLCAESTRHALDIGCGTGKVAVDLARRGIPVVGIDPDVRMAAVARRRGVTVEISAFEDWDDAGRRFDLITCGHAWHWIDPGIGPDKAARVLEPGGRIARFWNYHAVAPDLLAEFETIYADIAPEVTVVGRDPSRDSDAPDPFATHPAFTTAPPRLYRWQRQLTSGQWAGLLATFGDHLRLAVPIRERLVTRLESAIESHGGVVHVNGGTYLLLATRR